MDAHRRGIAASAAARAPLAAARLWRAARPASARFSAKKKKKKKQKKKKKKKKKHNPPIACIILWPLDQKTLKKSLLRAEALGKKGDCSK